jgi:NitT/TauT family transport system substrate-binding protein
MAPARLPVVVLLTLLTAIASFTAFAQSTKVTLGYANATEFLPAFVAKDRGIFAKHGLDVTMTAIPSSSLVPPTLISGSIDMGIATPPNLVLAAEAGLDLVATCGSARLLKTNIRVSLVARPGVVIEKPSDLAGKKVGVPGINSSIDLVLRKWLLDAKVPLARVTFIETTLPQMPDLLKSGNVDAVAAIEPILSRIVLGGIGVKPIDYYSEVNSDIVGAFWMSTRSWATAHSAAIQSFRAAYAESIAWIAANPDEAKKVEAKWLGFNGRAFPNFSLEMRQSDFDTYVNIGRELGVVRQAVDTSKLIWK